MAKTEPVDIPLPEVMTKNEADNPLMLMEAASTAVAAPPALLESSKSKDSLEIEDPKVPEQPANSLRMTALLQFWIVFMIVTGGSEDYVADLFSDTVEENTPKAGYYADATVFLTTAFSFLASAIPPSLSRADRVSLARVNRVSPTFKYKVLIPGLADLVITGMRYTAILYISPAVVSLLKASSQLFLLAIIQHFRGKKLTAKLALCLVGAGLGQVVVSVGTTVGKTPEVTSRSPAFIGVILAFCSGFLGSVRNIMEEALLQGDDLSAGGLLMAESWISLVGIIVVTIASNSAHLVAFLEACGAICAMLSVWPLILTLMFCTYGKDFGKLFVTKHGNALTAKVLSMLFPIITWILGLVTYLATAGRLGEGLNAISSPIRLAGFTLVAGCSVAFVSLQKKKK